MVLSASTDYILTAEQIMEDALSQVGGLVEGEPLSPDVAKRIMRTLNRMLKALQNQGLQVHMRRSISITPVAGQRTYTMGPSGADVTVARPLKIIQVQLKNTSDSNYTPLQFNTHEEYYALNSRESSAGNPTQYLYENTLTDGTLSVFPVPDSTTVATSTLEVIYRKPFDDIDAITDNIEIPPNWYEAIILQLAMREAHRYPIPLATWHILRADARAALRDVQGFEIEDEMQLQPDHE